MTRIVDLVSWHGSSPVAGNSIIANPILLNKSDTDTRLSHLLDGIVVPEEGEQPVYTFVKNLRLYAVEEPDYWIGDFRLSFGSRPFSWQGVDVFVQKGDSYVDPVANGREPLAGFTNNAGQYHIGNPLTIDPGEITTGGFGEWIQIQARVTSLARAGIPATFPITLQWRKLANPS